jgi:uncharacterized membrane protein
MRVYRKLLSYFLRGILLLAPVMVTFYTIYVIFNWLDTQSNNLMVMLFNKRITGLGIIVMVVFISLVGFIGSTVLIQPLLNFLEEMLERTPIVKDIYGSLKDFLEAFISNKKKFNRPVLVEMGKGTGLQRIGFITQDDMSFFHIKDKVAVYLPWSYSVAGAVYVVDRAQVQMLEGVSAADAMKFALSGGVTHFEESPKKEG